MGEKKLIDSQWVDIIIPQAPSNHTMLIVVTICILMIAGLVAVYFLFDRRSERKAARRLKKIKSRNLVSAQNCRDLAFEVADSLRMAFRVTRLDKIAIEAERKQEWELYRQQLLESCYGKDSPARNDIRNLVISAQSWLEYVPSGKIRVK